MSNAQTQTVNPNQANNQKQWSSKLFKPLDMTNIPGYPRQMPARYEKWLPKFTGNDVVSVEDHMSNLWAFFQLHPISDDAEDLAMKLFSATLYDGARRWYNGLPDASITTMDKLEEVFLKRWSVKEDPNMLLIRLNNITKPENETVREFHDKFERLVQKIPVSHHPSDNFLLFLYTKAFTGQIGFLLRDKAPRTIQEAQEMATKIEDNLSSSKIEPFSAPRVKIDAKPKVVHNVESTSDIGASLEKLQLTVDGMVKTQELMMNRIVNLERAQQQAPRVPYKGQFQRGTQVFKPKNDQEVPNTLAPTNMVDENPWCLQCRDSHWEHECPLNNGEHDQVNIIDHTIEGPQCCLNVTLEEHQEGIKEATRKARMEVINNLDQESREKLKKQEFQVYTRKKRMNQPLSTGPTTSQLRPPPMNMLLPRNPPKTDKVDLNFDFEGALAKMHVTIPLKEVIKVPSIKERFKFFFKVSDEPMDPPIMLQADHFRVQYDGHPPFFMTLLVNNKCLNNCMLDSGAGANMMSLRVMEKLGLKAT
jgi:hypothetical protein